MLVDDHLVDRIALESAESNFVKILVTVLSGVLLNFKVMGQKSRLNMSKL